RGPVKETLGPIGVAIQCGGVLVHPGDIVVGDDDGVVVVPQEEAAQVVARVHAIHDKEEKIKKALAGGQTTVELLGLRSRIVVYPRVAAIRPRTRSPRSAGRRRRSTSTGRSAAVTGVW